MAYCGPRGIPLSQFLSWDEDDQDAALAWQSHEALRCPGCGTHRDEWNPKAGGHRGAYVAEPFVCQGCVQIERERDNIAAAPGNFRGVHVVLKRNPGLDKEVRTRADA